eukprot:scaffold73313_cov27-Tisochrysis_lutea.AAC.3
MSARTPSTASQARSKMLSFACGADTRERACSVSTARSNECRLHCSARAGARPTWASDNRLDRSMAAWAAKRTSASAAQVTQWTDPGTRPSTCMRAAVALSPATPPPPTSPLADV